MQKMIELSNALKDVDTRDLARAVGVSVQAAYGWKNGTSLPSTRRLTKIAKFVGLPFDDLMRLVGRDLVGRRLTKGAR